MNKVPLEYKNISIKIENQTLFHQFNLSVKKGEKIVIFGKSGLGKTTLFRVLLGFLNPDSGKILINGREVNSTNAGSFRELFAYVPQNTNLGNESVKDFIEMVFSFKRNTENNPSESKLIEYLHEYQLTENILDKTLNQLSGGERQRIFLIICCLLDKPILLLDEPTASLDPNLKEVVKQKIIAMKEKTVLIISHDKIWQDVEETRLIKLNKEYTTKIQKRGNKIE